MKQMNFNIIVTTIAAVLLTMSDLSVAQAEITANTNVSRTGQFQLKWDSDGGETHFTVQQAKSPEFRHPKTIYEGLDLGRSISGKFDGVYYYRVRAGEGEWSDPVKVEVQHYDLSTAFLVLGIGAVVFIATVGLIIGGHIRHRREFADKIND